MNPQHLAESWPGAESQGWTKPGWYFWDETESFCHGPYGNEENARQAMIQYGETLL